MRMATPGGGAGPRAQGYSVEASRKYPGHRRLVMIALASVLGWLILLVPIILHLR